MKRRVLISLWLMCFPAFAYSNECVILLHGLARTADSMTKLERELSHNGYHVANVDYPSRKKSIEELANIAVTSGLNLCENAKATSINFVTHSLGGILVRQYYHDNNPHNVKRVVMLAPPNKGSEIVDKLKNTPGFELMNGPAGMQLGTDISSVPKTLGPVNFELGVIAGTQSINLILSMLLPNPDDGKVSVESAKVEGMCGFVALPTTHPFIMKNNKVIEEVIAFLQTGKFKSESADYFMACASKIIGSIAVSLLLLG